MEHPTPLPQSPPVTVQSPPVQETWAEQRSFWLIFGAFGTFGLMYGVGQVILVDLSRSLQLNLGTLGAALSFGSLASLPVMMIGGRLADRVGTRLILLLSDSAGEFRQPASGAETRGGFEGGVELSPDPTNPRDVPD